jgi:ectoine hydroxylase-related dioxygenase (phytanoyl-CoA dioxygenase family)
MITPAQTSTLEREGYVVVPDALDDRWVERLRRAFEGAPAQNDGTQHVEITPETPEADAWAAVRQHPALLAAAELVLGWSFRVRDHHGRNSLPGYGLQGLHADWMPRSDPCEFFVLTGIWMIDDFAADNGATRVVPRTHLIPGGVPKSWAQPAARHPEERVVTGKAGSLLLFNGHTWHSGRKNESRRPRRAAQTVVARGP